MSKKIYIASDHAGYNLKSQILSKSNEIMYDLGSNSTESVDYPDYAHSLAKNLISSKNSVGILICGSGVGMSIVANRYENIRAGLAFSPKIAQLMRQHNNANVLILPGRFIDVQDALNCVNIFLTTEFESGRHRKRLEKITK